MSRRLILASTSAYRRALLERLALEFSCLPPGIEEPHLAGEAPRERAIRLAHAKAAAVAAHHPEGVVIASDQVAAAGASILDKPGEPDRARRQLERLSGTTAEFYTACVVACPAAGFTERHLDTTRVSFRALSDAEIERYVAHERPLDCAGAFKAEALGISLLERIESDDPTGLIGLPLIWLAATLRRLGYAVP
ncbi:MAG TPA: nucleoside triphosphate pyrophosphatase [Steroidobacteraceae bacterium]|nr:nucleoside triphosphate pyrophosphatase [Steroidobacteraceae bacterium]